MNGKIAWYPWLAGMFKEFLAETARKSHYEIVDLYECDQTGFMKAVVKLAERHAVTKNISDIVVDNDFLEGFDKQTIRTLTYIATVEKLKADYSIVVQEMTNKVDEYILEIKSKRTNTKFKKSPLEISKDKDLLAKFSPVDANRIGYLAGVRETVKEYELIQDNT